MVQLKAADPRETFGRHVKFAEAAPEDSVAVEGFQKFVEIPKEPTERTSTGSVRMPVNT